MPASRRKVRVRQSGLRDPEAKLCHILVKTGATKFGLFRLSSGKLSPYYIDLRSVLGDAKGFAAMTEILETMVRSTLGAKSFDRIAGVPTAGVPYASVLAYRLAKPLLYVRKESRLRTGERRVEGQLLPGDRVVIVDDLIATGKNALHATEAVRVEGGHVQHAFVLIDRQEGGRATTAKAGVKLHALTTTTRIARFLKRSGVLDEDQYQAMLAQVAG